jgi:mono/diheme cytochrome c family protein
MLVHLPVGGLVLVSALELLALWPRFKEAAENRRVLLLFVAIGSMASAACGWLLSRAGGYEAQLLYRHKLAGFAVAGACIITLLVCGTRRQLAYRACLVATMGLLVVAGHWGSELTHGRDFLWRYAPGPLRLLLGEPARPAGSAPAPADVLQRRLYADVVQPILQQRCASCHGPEKRKGGLRLDSLADLQQGAENGPVLVAGKADDSPMIQRLLLPLDHEDHMPPEGRPQPTREEIGLLQWWINAGAPGEGKVGSFKPDAETLRMLQAEAARQPR